MKNLKLTLCFYWKILQYFPGRYEVQKKPNQIQAGLHRLNFLRNAISKIVNEVKFNIPTNSFMECGNIPMLCQASEEMIKSVKIYHGYYILENNPTEVIRHINSSAIYDMIETNK